MPTNELYLDNFRDVKEALVMQHIVNILPVVFDQLFRPKFTSVFVFVLQPLQPQSHAPNTGCIRTFIQ